jgi:hypothetical protein
MKRFLFAVLVIFCIGCFSSLVYGSEGTKILKLPNSDLVITVPEKAPDFFNFPARNIGKIKFPNETIVQAIESMNDDFTVDVITFIITVKGKMSVVALQVIYCPEGFQNFDMNKEHLTDFYEDLSFTKIGRATNILQRVDKLTDYNKIKHFLEE